MSLAESGIHTHFWIVIELFQSIGTKRKISLMHKSIAENCANYNKKMVKFNKIYKAICVNKFAPNKFISTRNTQRNLS